MWKKKKIHKMALCRGFSLLAIHIALLASLCSAADLFVYFDFEVSYITASPLGVPQQVPFSRSLYIFFSMRICVIISVNGKRVSFRYLIVSIFSFRSIKCITFFFKKKNYLSLVFDI